ncbi:MAG: FtsX-like permease family protein [Acidobacteriota bacterium]
MDGLIEASLGPRRFSMLLLGVFAGAALLLSAVGIYGVMSLSVAQRRREMGVRMALGANRAKVLSLVMRRAMALSLIGVAIGVAASMVLARLIESQLFGVAATDPATFVLVPLLLLASAWLATLRPALSAIRVDPAKALRQE